MGKKHNKGSAAVTKTLDNTIYTEKAKSKQKDYVEVVK